MRTIEKQTFRRLRAGPDSPPLQDLHLVRCRFESCIAPAHDRPGVRWLVRDVRLTRCVERGCSLSCTALEEVAVDGLKHEGRSLPFLWACVFRHVTLTGRIAAPKVNEHYFNWPAALAHAWSRADREYYRDVDWALDLRGATFSTFFTLPGVPADLVRRDPARHFVLRREAVMSHHRDPAAPRNIGDIVLDDLLASALPDVVVVVGEGSARRAEYLRAMEALRAAGVADRD